MMFTNEEISELEKAVASRLSQKRFIHTQGVRDMSVLLARHFAPDLVNLATASALLHDISKELTDEEQLRLLSENGVILTESDLNSPGVIHSYTSPIIVLRDFSRFAIEEILSAVRNHTLGAVDMSVLDEIVFLADFIEVNRTYESCSALRKKIMLHLEADSDALDVRVLHSSVVEAIDYTLKDLISKNKCINEKIIFTRNALLRKI